MFIHLFRSNYFLCKRRKGSTCFVIFVVTAIFFIINCNIEYNILGYTTDFVSWFRINRNISVFLCLTRETHLATPNLIETGLDSSKDLSVVYFVTSLPDHRKQRNAIRNTWGKNIKLGPIFLTGVVEDKEVMDFLINEAKIYNDIVIENFVDSYTNLTLKTGFIFKHFLRLFPNSAYLMKTDDDVLVNTVTVETIVQETLKKYPQNKLPIIGRLYEPYRPHRDAESKWYLPYWMYGNDLLPAYTSGTGYLVPGNVVSKILKNAEKVPMIPLEDVYFSGLVANRLCQIPLEHNKNFIDVRPILSHYCSYRKFATVHHLYPEELVKIWNKLHNDSMKCDGYLLNLLSFIFD